MKKSEEPNPLNQSQDIFAVVSAQRLQAGPPKIRLQLKVTLREGSNGGPERLTNEHGFSITCSD